MFYSRDDFSTNGQHVIDRKAYVVISDGPRVRRVHRNVYENDEMQHYVYYGGLVATVERMGGVWFTA